MEESRRQEIKEEIRRLQSLIDNVYDSSNPDIARWKQQIRNLEYELNNG